MEGVIMKTLIDLDETLLADAMSATGQTTKRATVVEALEHVVRRARALDYLERLKEGMASDLDDVDVIRQAQR
ncbi:MAG: type II toxin-antitoxin system VapB family antitoxin [Propionibacteriaceae bacterium]|nr:type II toxin-antitoxin system VapB family antitoxin [Propionibacteriaceae bacterium]